MDANSISEITFISLFKNEVAISDESGIPGLFITMSGLILNAFLCEFSSNSILCSSS